MSEDKRDFLAQIVLALGSVALGVLGGIGYLHDRNAVLTGILFFLAGGLLLAAGYYSKLEVLEVSKDGFKMRVAVERAERQAELGKTVDSDKLSEVVTAVESALSRVGTPTITQGPQPDDSSPARRSVQLVDDAVLTMATLTDDERASVQNELAHMSHPEFRPEEDDIILVSGAKRGTYRARSVPGTELRLWYRPADDTDSRLLVMMIHAPTSIRLVRIRD